MQGQIDEPRTDDNSPNFYPRRMMAGTYSRARQSGFIFGGLTDTLLNTVDSIPNNDAFWVRTDRPTEIVTDSMSVKARCPRMESKFRR